MASPDDKHVRTQPPSPRTETPVVRAVVTGMVDPGELPDDAPVIDLVRPKPSGPLPEWDDFEAAQLPPGPGDTGTVASLDDVPAPGRPLVDTGAVRVVPTVFDVDEDDVLDELEVPDLPRFGPRPDRRRNETPIVPPELVAQDPLPSPERGAEVARAIEAGAAALTRAAQPTPVGGVPSLELDGDDELELEPLDPLDLHEVPGTPGPEPVSTAAARPGRVDVAPTRPVEVSRTAYVPDERTRRLYPDRVAGYENLDRTELDAETDAATPARANPKLQLLTLPDMEVWLSAVDTLDALQGASPGKAAAHADAAAPLLGVRAPAHGVPTPPPLPTPAPGVSTAAPTEPQAPSQPTRPQAAYVAPRETGATATSAQKVATGTPRLRPAAALVLVIAWTAVVLSLAIPVVVAWASGALAWTAAVALGSSGVSRRGAWWTNLNGRMDPARVALTVWFALLAPAAVAIGAAGWRAAGVASVDLPAAWWGVLGAAVCAAVGAHALTPEHCPTDRPRLRDLFVTPELDGTPHADPPTTALSLLLVLSVGQFIAAMVGPAMQGLVPDALPAPGGAMLALWVAASVWFVATRPTRG